MATYINAYWTSELHGGESTDSHHIRFPQPKNSRYPLAECRMGDSRSGCGLRKESHTLQRIEFISFRLYPILDIERGRAASYFQDTNGHVDFRCNQTNKLFWSSFVPRIGSNAQNTWKFNLNFTDSTHWNSICRVLPDKLIFAQVFKILSAFHGILLQCPLETAIELMLIQSNSSLPVTFQYYRPIYVWVFRIVSSLSFQKRQAVYFSRFSHSCCKPYKTKFVCKKEHWFNA
jgi:hypothetical protein